MTDKEINEEARNALKNAGNPGGLSGVVYRGDRKQVKLFDHSGFYIYDFDLIKGTIKYRAQEEYSMDDETIKVVKRYIIKDMYPFLFICAFAVAMVVFVAISGSRANKLQKASENKTEQSVQTNEDLKSTLVIDSIQKTR